MEDMYAKITGPEGHYIIGARVEVVGASTCICICIFCRQMARGLPRVLTLISGCGQSCPRDGGAADCIFNSYTIASLLA